MEFFVPNFRIFVRWNKERAGKHPDAGGRVELARDGEVILSEPVGNADRLYGFCLALVKLLRLSGHEAQMPMCLQGHLIPDRTRED